MDADMWTMVYFVATADNVNTNSVSRHIENLYQ